MYIRVGFDIEFELPAPAPMLLMLNLHPSRVPTVVRPEALRVEPFTPISFYYDVFGNSCGRLIAPAGLVRLTNDAVVSDDGRPDEVRPGAGQHLVQDLPPDTIQFLLA